MSVLEVRTYSICQYKVALRRPPGWPWWEWQPREPHGATSKTASEHGLQAVCWLHGRPPEAQAPFWCQDPRIYWEDEINNARLRVTGGAGARQRSGCGLPSAPSQTGAAPGHLTNFSQSHETADICSVCYKKKPGSVRLSTLPAVTPLLLVSRRTGFKPALSEAKAHSVYKGFSMALNQQLVST